MAEEADPPEEIVRILAHFAAELDKDARELQAGLAAAGLLPLWVDGAGGTNSTKGSQPTVGGGVYSSGALQDDVPWGA